MTGPVYTSARRLASLPAGMRQSARELAELGLGWAVLATEDGLWLAHLSDGTRFRGPTPVLALVGAIVRSERFARRRPGA